MPLEKGKSKEIIQHNIKKMIDEGYPPKQAEAASYQKARDNSATTYGKPFYKKENKNINENVK